jgi:DNA-binding HxlR family transcriptional regulator
MFRTARQRATLCRECPVARVADLLGDSCSILVIRDLMEGPRRFGELQSSLSGISTRTLTNKLKELLRKKITRKQGVTYALTEKGLALQKVIETMRTYGAQYLK